MDDFIRRYLHARDGNRTPNESWADKWEDGRPPGFRLSFREAMENISRESIEEALVAAVESGNTYAQLHFRYESSEAVFVACDTLLDSFFFPLRHMGVIGMAMSPYETSPKQGAWLIDLYPIEAVPSRQRGLLTTGEVAALLVGSILGVDLHKKPGH